MSDILFKNGLVIDGTGRPGFRADVLVSGDRIACVGRRDSVGARVIAADGLAVVPGFIDVHSHTDALVLINPTCESKLTQGVTTEIVGNCGFSPAPRGGMQQRDSDLDILRLMGVERNWESVGDFLSALDSSPKSINIGTMAGHSSIRSFVMGCGDRRPTADETARMCRLMEECMRGGAFGLSSGLVYPPGAYAETEELIELSKAAAKYGGIYATHLRNEDCGLISAVEEAIEIGRKAGIGVQIAHHKACGVKNWGNVADTLDIIDGARKEGLDVWADQYPYTATNTSLSTMLPLWVMDGGREEMLSRLNDPAAVKRIREEMLGGEYGESVEDMGGWESVVLSSVPSRENSFMDGMSLAEISGRIKKHPVDVIIDTVREERGRVNIIHFTVSEEDVKTVMKHPAVLVASDAGARMSAGPLGEGKPHPRSYGTFPRVLGKYVREEGVLTLEEAVAKMTGKSARRYGIAERGEIAEGYFADITVFDPNTVRDNATFREPRGRASGIEYVMVNGEIVLESGRIIEENTPGRTVRKGIV